MKFFSKAAEPERAVESIYDPSANKVIAVFNLGTFETEDKEVISRLRELGYQSDKIIEPLKELKLTKEEPKKEIKEEPKKRKK